VEKTRGTESLRVTGAQKGNRRSEKGKAGRDLPVKGDSSISAGVNHKTDRRWWETDTQRSGFPKEKAGTIEIARRTG